jgi:hypothetical protein
VANIIIKSEERRQAEQAVAKSFGADNSAASREAVECIAARTHEAVSELKRMEEKRR